MIIFLALFYIKKRSLTTFCSVVQKITLSLSLRVVQIVQVKSHESIRQFFSIKNMVKYIPLSNTITY